LVSVVGWVLGADKALLRSLLWNTMLCSALPSLLLARLRRCLVGLGERLAFASLGFCEIQCFASLGFSAARLRYKMIFRVVVRFF